MINELKWKPCTLGKDCNNSQLQNFAIYFFQKYCNNSCTQSPISCNQTLFGIFFFFFRFRIGSRVKCRLLHPVNVSLGRTANILTMTRKLRLWIILVYICKLTDHDILFQCSVFRNCLPRIIMANNFCWYLPSFDIKLCNFHLVISFVIFFCH